MTSVLRRHTLLIAAALVAAAITATGCSDDEVIEQAKPAAIGFVPVVNKSRPASGTRAVPSINSDNMTAFDVWAFKGDAGTDDAYVMGSLSKGIQIKKGSSIGKVETIIDDATIYSNVWGYANKNDITYWPSGSNKLCFYAVSPSNLKNEVPNLEETFVKSAPSFLYTADEDRSKQRDIVVAGKEVLLTDVNKINGYAVGTQKYAQMSIPLTFKHALSQVVFDGNIEDKVANFKVEIISITLCNIYRTGRCIIGSDGTLSWVFTDKTKTEDAYTVTVNKTMQTNANGVQVESDGTTVVTAPVDFSGTDNIMVIPQTISAWTTTEDTPVAIPVAGNNDDNATINSRGSYLKIKCKITQGLNNSNLLAENQDYVYVPLKGEIHDSDPTTPWDSKWAPGIKYRYTLTFGLGFDSQGKLNGSPIKYSVSTTDWSSVDDSDVQL